VLSVLDAANKEADAAPEQQAALESIEALYDEEMGKWQSVEYAHLPIALSNIWYIREAVRATLKKAGYDG